MPTTSTEQTDRHDLDPRTERTRQAVVDAARDLLEASGPDAVTHGNVARRARVSRTTVYKHHGTRADLLRAAVDHVGKPTRHALTGDLETDLRAFVAHLVDDLADEHRALVFATFMERSLQDPAVATVRDEMMCEATEHFRAMVGAGVAAGRLRTDLDVDLALAGLVGTFLFRRYMAGRPVDAAVADRVVSIFLEQNAPR
jgi:AcrR family transcriptional regulator